MTYESWARYHRMRENGEYLDRSPRGCFAAVDLIDRLEKALTAPNVEPTRDANDIP